MIQILFHKYNLASCCPLRRLDSPSVLRLLLLLSVPSERRVLRKVSATSARYAWRRYGQGCWLQLLNSVRSKILQLNWSELNSAAVCPATAWSESLDEAVITTAMLLPCPHKQMFVNGLVQTGFPIDRREDVNVKMSPRCFRRDNDCVRLIFLT